MLKSAVSGLPFKQEIKDAVDLAKTSTEVKKLIEAETKKFSEILESRTKT